MDSQTQKPIPRNEIQLSLRTFDSKILFFNGLYKLPVAPYPSVQHLNEHVEQRLEKFRTVLLKEVSELDDILAKIALAKEQNRKGFVADHSEEDILTDIADWLGDLQIYCASEMAKFGLPVAEVLRIIMNSNFSKLGADGQPIYDADGKVCKGPGYWKPEPMLRDLIVDLREDHKRQQNLSF